MVQKNIGRRKGRRTKGYFYRAGRGWFAKQDGKFIPLTDQEGERYREEDTPDRLLKEAAARVLVAEPKVPVSAGPDAEVGFICARYLDHLKSQAGDLTRPVGKAKTYIDRGQTLFDFCYGLGGPINWYKLTPEGYRVLHGPDVALPHRSRFDATSPSRFHHTQTLAEVIIHVLTAAHNGRVAVMRFFGDGELTVEEAGRKLHPDCFFQLSHAGRQFNVMFEIDHANESLDSIAANAVREKLLIYEAHQDSVWQWWKQHGAGTPRPYFRVVFLTTTAERASHFLWLAGECARNRDRHLCYAAAQGTFLGSADPLRAPIFNDHHGHWQAIVDPYPTSHFARTPVRLSPPVNILGAK